MRKVICTIALILAGLVCSGQTTREMWGEQGFIPITGFDPYRFDKRNFHGKEITFWTYREILPPASQWWYCKSLEGKFDRQLLLPLFITAGDFIHVPEIGFFIAMKPQKKCE